MTQSVKHSEQFGNRIRMLRKKLRYTQLQLADKVGIPKSTLAGYENGIRRPKFETIDKLAHELNTSADFLIGITDDPHPSKPTKDLRKLLQSDDYHIDGKKLSNEDIEFAIQFLSKLAKPNDNTDIEDNDLRQPLNNQEN